VRSQAFAFYNFRCLHAQNGKTGVRLSVCANTYVSYTTTIERMSTKDGKHIFAFVNSLPPSAVRAVETLAKTDGTPYKTLLIRDTRSRKKIDTSHADIVVECDFSKPLQIGRVLLPYQAALKAITCRGEWNIARFIKVIPHVPYLRTPNTESLEWSSDKYEMRKRLRLFDPKHTPRFTLVKNNTKKERKRIAEKVQFPLVVKPANLAGSALVSICYHEDELETTLRKTFGKVKGLYKKEGRIEEPKILAEEYMEGEMYSLDSYVNGRGTIWHCPPVKVTTGKNIGHDDFYNYLRMTPTTLKKESVAVLNERAELAIHALGLRNVTVHTELLQVDGDWKIIELGPRIGGFRQILYELSCDINHSLNDILVRVPRVPQIPKKCKTFAASMRYYPHEEGVITEVKGIKKIKELESFVSMKVNLKVGDRTSYAKHGGGGVFDLTLSNADRSKLLADIRRIEKMVSVEVETRGQRVSAAKHAKKQVSKKRAAIKTSVKKVTKKTAKKPVQKGKR
jgi:hypothetical protein